MIKDFSNETHEQESISEECVDQIIPIVHSILLQQFISFYSYIFIPLPNSNKHNNNHFISNTNLFVFLHLTMTVIRSTRWKWPREQMSIENSARKMPPMLCLPFTTTYIHIYTNSFTNSFIHSFISTYFIVQYETVLKMMESVGQTEVITVYTSIEKKMRLEGVCLVIHFLQILVSAIIINLFPNRFNII